MYFDYKDQIEQSGKHVLANLLKQLLSTMDIVPGSVEITYDEHKARTKSLDFSTLIRLFMSAIALQSKVFIMLDGLDECNESQYRDIVEFIAELRNSHVKMFCTSRPHSSDRSAHLKPCITLRITAVKEDVENYILERLDIEWKHSPRLKSKVLETLSRSAQGR